MQSYLGEVRHYALPQAQSDSIDPDFVQERQSGKDCDWGEQSYLGLW